MHPAEKAGATPLRTAFQWALEGPVRTLRPPRNCCCLVVMIFFFGVEKVVMMFLFRRRFFFSFCANIKKNSLTSSMKWYWKRNLSSNLERQTCVARAGSVMTIACFFFFFFLREREREREEEKRRG